MTEMNLEDRLYRYLAAYERMPQTLRSSLGYLYRHLPRRVRWGGRYADFRHLATEVESWSAERIAEYQMEQLRMTLVHAEAYSPFYARRFAEHGFRPGTMTSFEDLAGCPLLTRRDLADHVEEMATTKPPPSARLYVATTGSTGSPVGFYLQKGVSRPKEQAFLEAQWRRAGYFDGARLAVIRGRVVNPRQQGPIATHDAARDWLILSSWHLTADRLREYLAAIVRFRPDILYAYPSSALRLAELVQCSGTDWPVPLRCLLTGSERITTPQRSLLERVFGCRVYNWYGHSERVVLAGEGTETNLLYCWPVYGYVEFGPPDSDGLREVIGTSFHNLAMPLIRYRTGDYVRLYDRDRDGAKEFDWPTIAAVEGREQEYLVTADGARIQATGLNMHDRRYENLYAIQFFQERPGHVEFRYVPSPRFDPAALPGIECALRRKLGDMEIVFREVDEIEKTARGKGKWVVSTLPSSSTDTGVSVA